METGIGRATARVFRAPEAISQKARKISSLQRGLHRRQRRDATCLPEKPVSFEKIGLWPPVTGNNASAHQLAKRWRQRANHRTARSGLQKEAQ
jgi:hypothetical protein